MNDVQGLREGSAFGNLDHEPIAHHRAVQRHHGIGIVRREQLLTERGIAASSISRSVRMLRPFPDQPLGQFWREHTVHQHSLRTPFMA